MLKNDLFASLFHCMRNPGGHDGKSYLPQSRVMFSIRKRPHHRFTVIQMNNYIGDGDKHYTTHSYMNLSICNCLTLRWGGKSYLICES